MALAYAAFAFCRSNPREVSVMSALFDKGSAENPSPAQVAAQDAGIPRLRVPHRNQVEMHWASLDELLEADHRARLVWAAVAGLRLEGWLQEIKAVEGNVGRAATDPRLLVALWVYATLEGIGSAREVARLCEKHRAYQWLCGGVTVNYHLLSDFRSQGGDQWDNLLTQIVASLLAEGLVTMNRVAQDGMRVRAHAGKGSFRRRGRLSEYLQAAREQVELLKRLAEESPEELTKRQQAARQRAARERAERVEEAIRNCEQLQAQRETRAKKSCRKPTEARASTTDPEARVMQFSDGGFRPGYNVQFSTTTETGIIVGVAVTHAGNDSEQLPPMLGQLQKRYDQIPAEALVDGGFTSRETIDTASQMGCTVYAPVKEEQKQLAAGKDPYAKRHGDSLVVAAWRARMGTAPAKAIYKLRGQTAEWVNALARNRGLRQMPVRGQKKCRIVAIAHNLMQSLKLHVEGVLRSG
jgi:transposase